MTKTVGIFGLGLIGTALAERLLAAGYEVVGYDVDQARGALLQELGGTPAVPEVIWQSDIILSAVFSTDQLADIIAAAPDVTDVVLVTMSTCDPDQIAELADTARERSIVLVEAPVSGTSLQVRQGTALLLLAGDPAGLDAFEKVADAISPNRERVGEIGNGNKTKLAINCVLGLNRAAVAEGLVFAEALGLDPAKYLQTALRSAARSDVMAAKGPMMVAREFTPLGRVAQSQKDFKLIREIAARNGHGNMPMVNRYLEVMENAEQAGDSDLDNSAVFLAVSRMAKS
ncbi:MAG: NAD(P)-dependent oxidoreductase [Paracoccaceae bacterium]|nr:NAD(P)-dependent oxidoreductase [Paracoccaceae bacterium]MDE2912456.1 NAD(P)-dependent oxidoreductase [Paracoccaceae bacterium]